MGNPQAANQNQVVQYAQVPTQPQQVQYVDQNGNPIQVPPQGQQAPTQQQQVQYVDQNGNPIQVVQQGQQPQVVLVQQQQQLATPGKFKAVSCLAQCPSCQKVVQTRLSYTSGLGSWLVCGGFICAGCFCGCCFIPFCMQSMKDVNHHCPDCCMYSLYSFIFAYSVLMSIL